MYTWEIPRLKALACRGCWYWVCSILHFEIKMCSYSCILLARYSSLSNISLSRKWPALYWKETGQVTGEPITICRPPRLYGIQPLIGIASTWAHTDRTFDRLPEYCDTILWFTDAPRRRMLASDASSPFFSCHKPYHDIFVWSLVKKGACPMNFDHSSRFSVLTKISQSYKLIFNCSDWNYSPHRPLHVRKFFHWLYPR